MYLRHANKLVGVLANARFMMYLPSSLSEVQCSETSWGNSLRGVGLEDCASSASLSYGKEKELVSKVRLVQQHAAVERQGMPHVTYI